MFEKSMERVRKFTVMDFGLLKITLFLLGIIVGVVAADALHGILVLLIIIFIILYATLLWRYFKK